MAAGALKFSVGTCDFVQSGLQVYVARYLSLMEMHPSYEFPPSTDLVTPGLKSWDLPACHGSEHLQYRRRSSNSDRRQEGGLGCYANWTAL